MPANLVLARIEFVKILGFALTKPVRMEWVTQIGTTVGNVADLSPEQERNEEVEHRTDIWSFGVVLYSV